MKSRRVYLAVIFINLVILVVILQKRGMFSSGEKYEKRLGRAQKVVETWGTNNFAKLAKKEDWGPIIGKIRRKNMENLNQVQEENLNHSISNLFSAFSDGSYESFLRFRVPGEYTLNTNRLLDIRTTIYQPDTAFLYFMSISNADPVAPTTNVSYKSNARIPNDPNDLVKMYVERVTKGEFYRNWWLSIDTDTAEVRLVPPHSIPLGALLSSQLSLTSEKLLGVRDFSYEPVFRHETTMKQLLDKRGEVPVAELSARIKLKAPDGICPFYVRWMWDANIEAWIPTELAVGSLYNETGIQPVF